MKRLHLESKADKDEVVIYQEHHFGEDEGKFSRCYFPIERAIEIRDNLSESIRQAQQYARIPTDPV